MKAPYPALPLHHHSSFEFRVARIHPASNKADPVSCTLETVALENCQVTYKALSYNWGENKNRVVIKLGDQPYDVTPNLHLALQHIRDPKASQLYFIDAVCINQNDMEERNTQVQKMVDIYQSAAQVVVFLGGENEYTSQAFD